MGYLTTVTVYNDGLHLLRGHSQDFCEKLYNAACKQEQTNFGVGYFANFASVQRSRHADDHTIYVHMGNTVTEVSPYSQQFKKIANHHPEFAKRLVQFLEQELEDLKKMVESQP